MKDRISSDDTLAAKVLAALARLDQKGTDEQVTCAMSIVYEAFRLHAMKRSFTADQLFVLAARR
ncbi:MAG: hypothetical protein JW884_13705 [Deltaproteobacteria bacterium]|nr:hypothetical protein [Deltaproteobacteria bacterium]